MTTGDMPTMLSNAYTSNTFGAAAAYDGFWKNQAKAHELAQARKIEFLTQPQTKEVTVGLRLVQVFIADTNDSLPLDDRILYRGEPKVTDLDDNELFFELDIRDILAKHNAKRVMVRNKKVKDREELLEPARVRDLKMTVVTIASF